MKYTYNVDLKGNKIVCVSHYAGKAVRGVSKCDTQYDEFNVETGMELAKLRCDQKIAKKRVKNLSVKLNKAEDDLVTAKNNVESLKNNLDAAINEAFAITVNLEELQNKLNKV